MTLVAGCAFIVLVLPVLSGCTDKPISRSVSHELTRGSARASPVQDNGGCLAVEAEYSITGRLAAATDIRWTGLNEVMMLSLREGVLPAVLGSTFALGAPIARRGDGRGELFIPTYLGASERFFAVAAPVLAIAWKPRNESRFEQHAFAATLDIDLQGGQLLILGAQRVGEKFAPDGAIAWKGSLEDGVEGLRPLLFSSTGPGARAITDCALMEVGSVRFLAGGSAVVVPGVEEGVYQYSEDGRLLRTWQSEEIGFDAGCGLSEEDDDRYSVDEPGRWAWVNQRRVVDEVIPLPEGPGLIVRSVHGGVVRWQLKVLRDEDVVSCPLPFEGSLTSILHADVLGDRIVLLLTSKALRLFATMSQKQTPNRYRDESVKVIVARYRS